MKDVSRTSPLKGLCIVALLCVFAVAAFAQSTTFGAIGGTVMDKTKAVIPNAKVTVTNTGTGAVSTTESDSFGSFRVVNLDPGTYTVSVQAPSFAAYKATGVIVEVGRITQLEAALAPGSQAESVEVTSELPTVNTIQQDFSSNINQTAINNLPTNGRRWSNFVLLTPGATPDGGFGLISFRGISGLLNNNTVDGGDNNQALFSEERGRTRISYTVSQSSIREFQVNTSNYSAEYGRAAGGVVNSVTKSGTNNIHGEAFYYIRDNTLGATNPFTTRTISNGSGGYTTVPFKPEDRRHQFGGSIGGPIIKDKLFFFFTYDGQRRNFPGVGQASNPTSFFAPITVSDPALAGKTCSQTSGSTAINDGQYLFCKGVTQAQANTGLGFLAAETGQVPRTGDQNILFPKLDWKINQNHTLTMSYNRLRWDSPAGIQTQPTVTYGVASFGNDYVKADIFIARLSSTITTNVTNEFRYQWGRDFEFETSQTPSAAEQAFNLDTSYGGRPPYITVTNGVNMGRPAFLERTAYPDERRNQFANTTNVVYGHHLFKFGFDAVRNNDLMDNLYNGGGSFSYTGTYARANFIWDLTNYANGVPSAHYGSFSQAFGPTAIEFHTWDYAVFLQDDWKVLPRLTLSMGVRYEYELMPRVQYPVSTLPQTQRLPGDYNNIGPRIGFAWDVFGDGKTAVRGGYGIYYGRINNGAIGQALFANGSPSAQINYTNVSSSVGPKFPLVWTTAPTGLSVRPNGFYFDPNIQNPQIHQADLIIEREITKNTVFSVNYLLSLGRELPNFYDVNINPSTQTQTYTVNGGPFNGKSFTVPVYTTRTNTAFGPIMDERSDVNSNYNALVVQVNRRMTNGLQFMTNYTWSHALDNGQNSQTQSASYSQVFDPYNLKLEYGRSNFDIRHRVVGSVVWQPQYFKDSGKFTKSVLDGWGLAPLVTVSSGRAYTENISGNGPTYGVGGGLNGSGGVFRLAPLVGRNNWSYPIFANVDMRVSRSFKMPYREGHSLEFLIEAFNLFNHQIITGVNNTMYSVSGSTLNYNVSNVTGAPLFGTATQAGTNLYRERQVQLAVRYSF
jgi:outer membrane receptor protein involved in Fe transport